MNLLAKLLLIQVLVVFLNFSLFFNFIFQVPSSLSSQEQCLISGSKFLRDHWNEFSVRPLILCSSEEAVARVSKDYSHVISIIDYVKGLNFLSILQN